MCKKIILRFFLFLFLIIILLIIFVNYIIDPKMENNYFRHSFNEKKFDFGFYSSFVMYDKLKNDKYVLVFGTSRTGRLGKDSIKDNVLNFSTSLYGYPEKVYNFLSKLDEKQILNITKVFYLIDFHTFGKSLGETNMVYGDFFLKNVYSMYTFNQNKIWSAISTTQKNILGDTNKYISEFGYEIVDEELDFIPEKSTGDIRLYRTVVLDKVSYSDKQFEYLEKIDIFSKKHNIKVKYFTPVFNDIFFKAIYERGFFDIYISKVLNKIDKLYSFLYMDNISNDNKYFFDVGHYKMEVQNLMIKNMENENSEYVLNKLNKDDYLEKLKKINTNLKVEW